MEEVLSLDNSTPDFSDDNDVHVVVGGCGYPGYHLGMELRQKGHKVKLADVHEPTDDVSDQMTFVKVRDRCWDYVTVV